MRHQEQLRLGQYSLGLCPKPMQGEERDEGCEKWWHGKLTPLRPPSGHPVTPGAELSSTVAETDTKAILMHLLSTYDVCDFN